MSRKPATLKDVPVLSEIVGQLREAMAIREGVALYEKRG